MTRRTPIRHTVHRHTRDGRPVRKYIRGEGKREKVGHTQHIKHPFESQNEKYNVSIKYEEGRPFNVTLNEPSLESALHRSIIISPDKIPSSIILREVKT